MSLDKETIKRYKSIGHNLKPVVMVSDKGLSEGVMKELDRALEDHELIKIKVAVVDRALRKRLLEEATQACSAQLLQEIGKTGLIYRKSQKKGIKTSNVR